MSTMRPVLEGADMAQTMPRRDPSRELRGAATLWRRMQSVPPPQPLTQPARPGWGRFWLGVLAGGCSLLVLEALAALVVVLVVGVAVGSAVRQAGSGGLPGGLGLPTGVPPLSTRSDPCAPQPCLAHGGVTVLVANVNRSAGPSSDGKGHLVKLDLTFVGTSGTHTVTPEEVAVRDSSGSMVMPGMDAAAAQCGSTSVSEDVQAGQRAGPYTVCYAVGGAQTGTLTVVWISPEDLSIVELALP
jgi:hypothetical protein